MSLLEYLEIISTILNNYMDYLDELYKEAKFLPSKNSSKPICFTIENGELGLIVEKNVYSSNSKAYIISKFYKSSIVDAYISEEGGIYTVNSEYLNKAIEFVEENKANINELFKRNRFYGKFGSVVLEFTKTKDNPNEIVIEITYGDRHASHLSLYVRDKYFETVDVFSINWLKEIKVPDNIIPAFIKDKIEGNNFIINEFKEEELKIHEWHKNNSKEREYTRIRGYKVW